MTRDETDIHPSQKGILLLPMWSKNQSEKYCYYLAAATRMVHNLALFG